MTKLSDGDGTWGLIELVFVYSLAIGFGVWQWYSINKTLKKSKDEDKSDPSGAEGEHTLDPPASEKIER